VEHSNTEERDEDAPLAFIGEGIRRERDRRGMSLAQLSSQVGLSISPSARSSEERVIRR
jgi:transcriptional regulator with XRE-family HTH domain